MVAAKARKSRLLRSRLARVGTGIHFVQTFCRCLLFRRCNPVVLMGSGVCGTARSRSMPQGAMSRMVRCVSSRLATITSRLARRPVFRSGSCHT